MKGLFVLTLVAGALSNRENWLLPHSPLRLNTSTARSLRIVGGEVVTRGEYPWLVNRKNRCGGALIAPQWVLTAGHCDIWVGELLDMNRFDMTAQESFGIEARVAEKIPHPNYTVHDYVTDLHDIQLVRLEQKVKGIKPARLISPREEAALESPRTMLTVAGWGARYPFQTSDVSPLLRHVHLPVISNADCGNRDRYGAFALPYLPKRVYDSMMCAGFDEGGKDSCVGDSGGPLFTEIDQEGVLVGIVSWATGCAEAMRPGVYTRISSYRSWIERTIREHDLLPVPRLPRLGSCEFGCGLQFRECHCDANCVFMGNCCADFESQCVRYAGNTPYVVQSEQAVEMKFRQNGPATTLGPVPIQLDWPPGSCVGNCNYQSSGHGSCWCDRNCKWRRDCCEDYRPVCLQVPNPPTPIRRTAVPTVAPSIPPNLNPAPFSRATLPPVRLNSGSLDENDDDQVDGSVASSQPPKVASCHRRCGIRHEHWLQGHCSCDQFCIPRGDCCPDFRALCPITTPFVASFL